MYNGKIIYLIAVAVIHFIIIHIHYTALEFVLICFQGVVLLSSSFKILIFLLLHLLKKN